MVLLPGSELDQHSRVDWVLSKRTPVPTVLSSGRTPLNLTSALVEYAQAATLFIAISKQSDTPDLIDSAHQESAIQANRS